MILSKWVWVISASIFVLIPWYYLNSGEMQPVDFSVILMFLTVVLSSMFSNISILFKEKIYVTFIYFTIFDVFITFINYVLFNNEESIILIIHNIYYFILLTCFSSIFIFFYQFQPERFFSKMQNFIFLSTIIPLIYYLKGWELMGAGRSILCFNNPNQLSFFSLVSISIIFYLHLLANRDNIRLNQVLSICIININFLFLMIASSRASVVACLLYVLCYFIIFKVKLKGKKSIITAGLVSLVIFFISAYAITIFSDYMFHSRRDLGLNQISGDISSRMFDGLSTNFSSVWFFIFGTGVGRRLTGASLEYHDNFINIFSETGVIGFLIYFSISVYILKKLHKEGFLFTLPYLCYLFYSLFQFTYRTRMNWIFLSFIIFISSLRLIKNYKLERN